MAYSLRGSEDLCVPIRLILWCANSEALDSFPHRELVTVGHLARAGQGWVLALKRHWLGWHSEDGRRSTQTWECVLFVDTCPGVPLEKSEGIDTFISSHMIWATKNLGLCKDGVHRPETNPQSWRSVHWSRWNWGLSAKLLSGDSGASPTPTSVDWRIS